jgi:hypothetical protein
MRADVIAGDDNTMICDFVDAELIRADAPRHLLGGLHFGDNGLRNVRIGGHTSENFHAQIYQSPCHGSFISGVAPHASLRHAFHHCFKTVPGNLHTNAQQYECNYPQDSLHCFGSDFLRDLRRIGVTQ